MIVLKKVPTLVHERTYPGHILTDLPWDKFVKEVLLKWAGYTSGEADSALEGHLANYGESGLSTVGFFVKLPHGYKFDFVYLLRLGSGGVWVVPGFESDDLESLVENLNPEEADKENKVMLIWGLILNSLTAVIGFFVFLYCLLAFILSTFGVDTIVCSTGDAATCHSQTVWILAATANAIVAIGFFATSKYIWRRIRS